jgi:hypothetical protein
MRDGTPEGQGRDHHYLPFFINIKNGHSFFYSGRFFSIFSTLLTSSSENEFIHSSNHYLFGHTYTCVCHAKFQQKKQKGGQRWTATRFFVLAVVATRDFYSPSRLCGLWIGFFCLDPVKKSYTITVVRTRIWMIHRTGVFWSLYMLFPPTNKHVPKPSSFHIRDANTTSYSATVFPRMVILSQKSRSPFCHYHHLLVQSQSVRFHNQTFRPFFCFWLNCVDHVVLLE